MAPTDGLRLARAVGGYATPEGTPHNQLEAGTVIELTGQVSDRLYYRSTQRDTLLEPFLQVRLPDDKVSWIYADPANFAPFPQNPKQWQWNNRLRSLLTPEQLTRYRQVRQQWDSTDQAGVLLLTYQATRRLRTALEQALRNYPLLPAEAYRGLLPGCWAYQTNGSPGWWIDYNQWSERASVVTEGAAEKALFDYYRERIYPPDGIEYHATAWEFPVSTTEKHSILGRGVHYQLLLALEQEAATHTYVSSEWEYLKTQLLNDICTPGNSYWVGWSQVKAELDTLLHTQWELLNAADLTRLRHRREELSLPEQQERYLGKRDR